MEHQTVHVKIFLSLAISCAVLAALLWILGGFGLELSRVQAASTHTVCPSGCTYTSIQAALDDAATVDGDTIKIAAGTYAEYVVISKSVTLIGGYPYPVTDWDAYAPNANRTIIDGEGTHRSVEINPLERVTVTLQGLVVQRGYDTNYNGGMLFVNNAQVLITDCEVIDAVYGNGLYVGNKGTSQIVNTVISDNQNRGIYLNASSDTQVINTTVTGSGGEGVYITKGDGITFSNVTVQDSGWYGFYFFLSKAFIEDSEIANNSSNALYGNSNSLLILSSNFITGNARGVYLKSTVGTLSSNTIANNQNYGVYLEDNNNTTRVSQNTITGNNGNGAVVARSVGQIFENNFIVANTQQGIMVGGTEASPSSVDLVHNTLVGNGTTSARGIGIQAGAYSHLTMTNNIVATHTFGVLSVEPTAHTFAEHTLWYHNTYDTGVSGGGLISTTGDVYGDPAFVGGTSSTAEEVAVAYHIRGHSAAIDAGVATSLTLDYDGEGRVLDIGADEFPYGVRLVPNYWETHNPDDEATYVHQLQNTGSQTATISLGRASSQGWTTEISPSVPVELASGESATVVVTVTVPLAGSGSVDTTTVVATVLPTVTDSVKDVTWVDLGVRLTPNHSQNTIPDQSVTYTHVLTNDGDTQKTFQIDFTSSQGWATLVTPNSVDIPSGDAEYVTIRVTLPATAAVGMVDYTIVTATGAAELLATAQNTTTVLALSGVTRYVARSGYDYHNNCVDSTYPCRSLDHAASEARSGDTIKIAKGTYTDTKTAPFGALAQVYSKDLLISGGYNTSNWDAYLPETNITILDAEELGVVLYGQADGLTLTLQGLSFQRGGASETTGDGGVYIRDARLIMTDCSVINTTGVNTKVSSGLHLEQSDGSQVAHNTIIGKQNLPANTNVIGISLNGSTNATLSHNEVLSNSHRGIYLNSNNVTVTLGPDNRIMGNKTGVYIGGGFLNSNSDINVVDSQIYNNNEGGVYVYMYNDVNLISNVITGNAGDGVYLHMQNDALLRQNDISHNSQKGFYSYLSNNVATLISNTVDYNTQEGVFFSYGGRGSLRGNEILGNAKDGIYIERSDGITLTGNLVQGNGGGSCRYRECVGIYVLYGSDRQMLSGNVIAGNLGEGLRLQDSLGHRVDNNIIVGNQDTGLVLSKGTSEVHSDALIRHNTIVGNGGESGVIVGANSTAVLTNNIIASHTVGLQTLDPTANVYAYNTLWYDNSEEDFNTAAGGIIVTYGDVWGDPRFAGGTDFWRAYHIRAGSAAIDAGTVTSLTTDIDGEPRAPDIGVDEFPYAVQIVPDYRSTYTAGSTWVSYTHRLTNTGAVTQTFGLSIGSRLSWPYTLTVQHIGGAPFNFNPATGEFTLGSGEWLTLTLEMSPDIDKAVNTTLITVTSRSTSTLIQDRVSDITLLGVGVELEPNYSEIISAGTTLTDVKVLTYPHTLTNIGRDPATYVLELRECTKDNSCAWTELTKPDTGGSYTTTFTVGANMTKAVEIRVTVPATTAGAFEHTAWITVTDSEIPEAYDVVEDRTIINPTAGTRYVTTSGVDALNNCRFSAYPCAGMAQAVQQAQPGDQILVAAGTYTETNVRVEKELNIRGGYMQGWSPPSDPILSSPSVLDAQGDGSVFSIRGTGITVTLSGLTFKGGQGSNVFVRSARLVMTDCSVMDAESGNALYLNASDDAYVARTRVVRNQGNGIYVSGDTNLRLDNSFVAENSGDGILLVGDGTLEPSATLRHNTIASNAGFGVNVFSSTMSLVNTIIANHTVGITVTGGGVSGNTILWYNNDTNYSGATVVNEKSGDPKFFGGPNPLRAYHILASSAAINASSLDAGLTEDIDGDMRSFTDFKHDIGADEFIAGVRVIKTASADALGPGEQLTYTITLFNTRTRTFNATVTDILPSQVSPNTTQVWTPSLGAFEVWTQTLVVMPDEGYIGTLTNVVDVMTDLGVEDRYTHTVELLGTHDVSLSPNNSDTSEPDREITYNHTLRNTGNLSGTFSLVAHSSQGWQVDLDPPGPITLLQYGDEQVVGVTIAVPADMISDTQDTTTVTATLDSDSSVYDTATDTTQVSLAPDVALGPDQSASGVIPDTALKYTFAITNNANGPDTFALSTTSTQGWTTVIQPGASIALNNGESQHVTVTLTVPPGTGGLTDVMDLTAQSLFDASVSATAQATTEVEHSPGVALGPDRASYASAGTTIGYAHTVTNTGNGSDIFTLDATSSKGFDLTYPPMISLGYGKQGTVVISVTVPAGADGLVDETQLTATSQSDSSVSDTALDRTTVGDVPDIQVTPASMSAMMNLGQTYNRMLTISNQGNATLTWTLATPSVDWLSAESLEGSVSADSSTAVDIGIDATGKTLGIYNSTLQGTSNDPDESTWEVSVTMVVTDACLPISRADFSFAPATPEVGQTVFFTGTAEGSDPITYTWDFDDESGDIGQYAQHTFSAVDTYAVALSITNPCVSQPYTLSKAVVISGTASAPNIEVTRTLNVVMNTKQQKSWTLTIGNTGDADLSITDVQENPQVNWLNVPTWPATVAPDSEETLTLYFDTSNVPGDSQVGTDLRISTNDPDAEDNPAILTINLTVNHNQIYMPLVLRN